MSQSSPLKTQLSFFVRLWGGILLGVVLNVLNPVAFMGTGNVVFSQTSIGLLGLTQIIYLGPLAYWFFKKRWYAALQGVLLTMSLTILFSAICGGLILK